MDNNITKLKLVNSRKLVRVTGTNSKGAYDVVATLGADDSGKLHDVIMTVTDYDAIPAEGLCERDDVWVSGILRQHTDPSKRYVVNKGTPDAYERLVMSHAEPCAKQERSAFRGKPFPQAKDLPVQTPGTASPSSTQSIAPVEMA